MLFLLAAVLLPGIAHSVHAQPQHGSAAPGGGKITWQGSRYSTYTVSYPAAPLAMYWRDRAGGKLKSIGRLKTMVERDGRSLLFATNAGMYMENNAPLGLYVERGQRLRSINLAAHATGNFYLQPNGVFLLTARKAAVLPSAAYGMVKDKVLFATQSGPMLVTNGSINSNFTRGSANINIRSGVGVNKDGRVVFAISDGLVNFYDFATLFKEALHCDNALFLDGSISRMYLPALGMTDTGGSFGAMIGVTERR